VKSHDFHINLSWSSNAVLVVFRMLRMLSSCFVSSLNEVVIITIEEYEVGREMRLKGGICFGCFVNSFSFLFYFIFTK